MDKYAINKCNGCAIRSTCKIINNNNNVLEKIAQIEKCTYIEDENYSGRKTDE